MGILWFGGAMSLEDLKEKDLKKEKLVQEVQQDQLVVEPGDIPASICAFRHHGALEVPHHVDQYIGVAHVLHHVRGKRASIKPSAAAPHVHERDLGVHVALGLEDPRQLLDAIVGDLDVPVGHPTLRASSTRCQG